MRIATGLLLLGVLQIVWATPDVATPTSLPSSTTSTPANSRLDPENSSRGKLLYENHCTSCHSSIAHRREKRKASNLADITVWVTRWSSDQQLKWTKDEIDDVVSYLNQRFYKFDK